MAEVHFKTSGITTHATKRSNGNPDIAKADRKERGKIKTFSPASRRRLRINIMDLKPPEGWQMYSLTLTVPGEVMTDEETNKMFAMYKESKLRRVRFAFIWRKEIQSRGQQHWHIILFLHPDEAYTLFVSQWWDILGRRADLPGARTRSASITPIIDSAIWNRYMQDHLSKLKSGQVALSGRHWGITNRKYLNLEGGTDVKKITDNLLVKYLRCQRRLFCPFRSKKTATRSGFGLLGNSGYIGLQRNPPCPFGYRLGFTNKRGFSGRSDFFSEPSKRDRLKDYIVYLEKLYQVKYDESWQVNEPTVQPTEAAFFEEMEIADRIAKSIAAGHASLNHSFCK